MVSVHPARWCTSPLGVMPAGLGDSVGHLFGGSCCALFQECILGIFVLLDMPLALWVPTPCDNDAFSVGTLKWVFSGKGWQRCHETTFSPLFGRFFLECKKTFHFFGGYMLDASCWEGWASRAWPSQLSIEFINVGGWLTFGDLALDSCAQFLAVAEQVNPVQS